MDGDPAVEDQLDSFSLTFPLPYRIAFIVVLGLRTPWTHGGRLLTIRYHRRLGMGPKPSLPLPSQHRCAVSHTIPPTSIQLSTAASQIYLPPRVLPLDDANMFNGCILAV
jgi:hypothetical protein